MCLSWVFLLSSTHIHTHKKKTDQEIKTSNFKASLAAILDWAIREFDPKVKQHQREKEVALPIRVSGPLPTYRPRAREDFGLLHGGCCPSKPLLYSRKGNSSAQIGFLKLRVYEKKKSCHLVYEPRKRTGHWRIFLGKHQSKVVPNYNERAN